MNREGPTLAKVLLVEDNEADVVLTREILKRESVRIDLDVVHDGDEAPAYLHDRGSSSRTVLPHLVLLDRHLPRLDGDAVIRKMRADPGLSSIPIVILSGSETDRERIIARERGPDAYIVKPVRYDNLAAAVQKLSGVRFKMDGPYRCLCVDET